MLLNLKSSFRVISVKIIPESFWKKDGLQKNDESTPKSPILGKPDQIRTFDIFYPIEIQLITITRLILFKTIQHVL